MLESRAQAHNPHVLLRFVNSEDLEVKTVGGTPRFKFYATKEERDGENCNELLPFHADWLRLRSGCD